MAVERFDKKPNSWGEDEKKAVELMLGHIQNQKNEPTFDLLGRSTKTSPSSSMEVDLLELGEGQCLPPCWEKCLDLKTGQVYYMNSEGSGLKISKVSSIQKISKFISVDEEEKIDLKLKLSSSDFLNSGKKTSDDNRNTDDKIAEEVECTMKLVGCPTCLMYFMVASLHLQCPRCKGSKALLNDLSIETIPEKLLRRA